MERNQDYIIAWRRGMLLPCPSYIQCSQCFVALRKVLRQIIHTRTYRATWNSTSRYPSNCAISHMCSQPGSNLLIAAFGARLDVQGQRSPVGAVMMYAAKLPVRFDGMS